MDNTHRTYEPLKFLNKTLGRFFWVPLTVASKTRYVSYAPTWEDTGERWGPTLIVRIPLTHKALGAGVWLDAPKKIVAVHTEDAEFDAYCVVNGLVDRTQWSAARKQVAAMGLDPDDEMEAMQMLGIFA